jgi:hypothetical protein
LAKGQVSAFSALIFAMTSRRTRRCQFDFLVGVYRQFVEYYPQTRKVLAGSKTCSKTSSAFLLN